LDVFWWFSPFSPCGIGRMRGNQLHPEKVL
jgi:hypothetical protein